MISIIVPVYNVEQYLDRCIASLVGQTYSDIEIILVNDGSSDSSGDICKKWAEQDARVVYAAKENGGLSDARNCGIEIARGDYLGFVDSDDYVDSSMFETLLRDIEQTGASIATCDVKDVFENDSEVETGSIDEAVYVVSAEDALRGMARSELPRIWVPTRLYPRSVFDAGFRFPLGKAYEDAYTIVDLMALVETVSVNASQLYYYCHRGETITTGTYNAKSHDMIEAWEHGRELSAARFPSLDGDFAFRCLWARCTVLDKMILAGSMDGSPEEYELVSYIRTHFAEVSNHPALTSNRKALCRVLRLSLPLYRAIVRVWRSRNKSYI